MTVSDWIRAISDAAAAWRDPEYPAREAAVRATLEAPNRFTEEGLAFALNHLTHQLRPTALRERVAQHAASEPRTVGVVCSGDAPLDGLTDTLAALLVGHRVIVCPAPESPALLPAFLDAVMELSEAEDEAVRFADLAVLFSGADAVVASGDEDALDGLTKRVDAADIPSERRWLKRSGFAIAVIDGGEDAETRSGLAEDLLLHEGLGPRAPSVVWAPAGLDPDGLLDTLAGFRELYPPHPDTDGTLRMATAFLVAAKQPHATGPGFLLSKGEPEPQAAAHVRWSEYASLSDVADWLQTHRDTVDFVVARPEVSAALGAALDIDVPFVEPGDAHRPRLFDDGLLAFLAAV
ncbi:MAG: hypothetical protein ABJF88_02895 [Rhodothermales bacterium]